jgi:hypothetical protein
MNSSILSVAVHAIKISCIIGNIDIIELHIAYIMIITVERKIRETHGSL